VGWEQPVNDHWIRSSHSFSNSNCVELRWVKSSHSTVNGQCAEVRGDGSRVQMRDSKDPDGPVLDFSPGAWMEFVAEVKSAA
jgi:hypothetical protein